MYNYFKLEDNFTIDDFKKNLKNILKIIKNENNAKIYKKDSLEKPLNLEYIYNVSYYVK
jgi:hypothetical protein